MWGEIYEFETLLRKALSSMKQYPASHSLRFGICASVTILLYQYLLKFQFNCFLILITQPLRKLSLISISVQLVKKL